MRSTPIGVHQRQMSRCGPRRSPCWPHPSPRVALSSSCSPKDGIPLVVASAVTAAVIMRAGTLWLVTLF